MKVISFCVWGDSHIYDIGLLKNLDLSSIYKDWECWIFCPKGYHLIPKLKEKNCKIYEMKPLDIPIIQTLWRFIPMFNKNVDIMISRDCDARLTEREYNVVSQFENSDYTFQILRDHDAHFARSMMAGMIGCKPKLINFSFPKNHMFTFIKSVLNGTEDCSNFSSYIHHHTGYDEVFLAKYIYNEIKHNVMDCSDRQHPYTNHPIGHLNDLNMFIGNKFTENDHPVYNRGY